MKIVGFETGNQLIGVMGGDAIMAEVMKTAEPTPKMIPVDVLDKIRDEIQKEKENIHFDLNEQKAKWVNSGIYDGLTWAQEIIYKYTKGEGE